MAAEKDMAVTLSPAEEVARDSVEKGEAAAVEVPTPAEDRSLLRRIDLYLIPVMLFSYLFQTLDKSALGFSTIMGLETDLSLTGTEYSWASSIYYFGYLAFSYPASYLIVRLPVGKVIAGACILWGGILMCTAGTTSYGGLMAARFFLGFAEAAIAPGLAAMVAMWYKRSEQPLRHGVWFLGNVTAGFFASLLAYAISFINGSIATWKILFLIFGAVTMSWGICLAFLLPDHPSTARFLKPEQRQKAILRLRENMGVVKDETFKMYQLREGLMDVKVWLLILIFASANLANGLSSFQSIVIKGFGFSTVHTYVVQMIPTAFQAIYVGIACIGSTYIKNSRTYFMMFLYLLSVIGAVMVNQIDSGKLWARFFGYCLCIAFSGNMPMIFAMATGNITGFTKKTTANAALFIAYCASNIASPHFFLSSESPAYPTGFRACLICLAVSTVLTAVLRGYLIWENKRRDREFGAVSDESEDAAIAHSLKDKTDWEQPQFRYIL